MKHTMSTFPQSRPGIAARPLERETALVKIQPRGITAAELAAICGQAGARVVDGSEWAIILEITDTPDTVAAFIDAMRGFGMIDVTRSGRVVMPRATAAPAVASLLLPTAPTPFTSQADGASDEAAA